MFEDLPFFFLRINEAILRSVKMICICGHAPDVIITWF